MWNLIICDDQPGCAELLARKIKKFGIDDLQHIYDYASPDRMIFGLQENVIDASIYLLDIKLGDKNGIHIAEEILRSWPDSQIIFMSGYDDYYEDVYDVDHVYFIKKPVNDGILKKSLQRALSKLTIKKTEFFYVENKQGKYIINFDDIYFFEKQQRKVLVRGRNGELLCSFYDKFAEIKEQFPHNFLQCHNSIIVNLKKVYAIERDCFIMRGGGSIPISRSHHKMCQIKFAQYINDSLL